SLRTASAHSPPERPFPNGTERAGMAHRSQGRFEKPIGPRALRFPGRGDRRGTRAWVQASAEVATILLGARKGRSEAERGARGASAIFAGPDEGARRGASACRERARVAFSTAALALATVTPAARNSGTMSASSLVCANAP